MRRTTVKAHRRRGTKGVRKHDRKIRISASHRLIGNKFKEKLRSGKGLLTFYHGTWPGENQRISKGIAENGLIPGPSQGRTTISLAPNIVVAADYGTYNEYDSSDDGNKPENLKKHINVYKVTVPVADVLEAHKKHPFYYYDRESDKMMPIDAAQDFLNSEDGNLHDIKEFVVLGDKKRPAKLLSEDEVKKILAKAKYYTRFTKHCDKDQVKSHEDFEKFVEPYRIEEAMEGLYDD